MIKLGVIKEVAFVCLRKSLGDYLFVWEGTSEYWYVCFGIKLRVLALIKTAVSNFLNKGVVHNSMIASI